MNEGTVGTTERSRNTRGRMPSLAVAFVLVAMLSPRLAHAMAADGALITNNVTATYGGSGGITIKYTVSYMATANVLVSCPVVSLAKVATPTVQSAAGVVTFQVWVANRSLQASAFNVVITDRLPDNMTYVGASLTFTWFSGAPVVTTTNAQTNAAPPWLAGQPNAGQGSPYYLRWTINQLGPGRSGFIQYLATVL